MNPATRLAFALTTDVARFVTHLVPAPRACQGHWCRACGWPHADAPIERAVAERRSA